MASATYIPEQIRPLVGSHTRKGKAGSYLSVGMVVHKNADGDWAVAAASTEANASGLIGICVSGAKGSIYVDVGEEMDVVTFGPVAGFVDLDVTKTYYLHDNFAGEMTDTPPTLIRAVGQPESEQIFYVNPDAAPVEVVADSSD